MKAKMRAVTTRMNISNIISFFLVLLFILLPFNALINTFFSEKLGLELVKGWKEALIAVVFMFSLIGFRWAKLKKSKDLSKETLSGLVFFGLVLAYWAFQSFDIVYIRAVRLDLLPIMMLWFGLMIGQFLDVEKEKFLYKTLIVSSVVSLIIGLIMYFLGGGEFWVNFGFRNDWSTFYTNEALAFCQRIENSEVCRFQGFISGPNQLAAFLVVIMGLVLKYVKNNWYKTGVGILFFASILLTFSRSGLLAFICLIGLYLIWENKKIIKENWKTISGVIAFASIVFVFVGYEYIFDFFSRPESSSEHLRLWKEGFNFWKESIWFGNGIGSVGPGARYIVSDALIPESWFLQVAGQYGLLGLIVFVGWYISTIFSLCIRKEYMLALVWLVLLIPLNLLHIFEASVLVYALGIFSGIQIGKSKLNS